MNKAICSFCGIELKPVAKFAMRVEGRDLYNIRLTCPRWRASAASDHDSYYESSVRGVFRTSALFSENELSIRGIKVDIFHE